MAKKPRTPDLAALPVCATCGKRIGAKGYAPTCLGHEPRAERASVPGDHWRPPPR